jgi:hypothetical protein
MTVLMWLVVTGALLGNGHPTLALLGLVTLLCGSVSRPPREPRLPRHEDDPRPDLHLTG